MANMVGVAPATFPAPSVFEPFAEVAVSLQRACWTVTTVALDMDTPNLDMEEAHLSRFTLGPPLPPFSTGGPRAKAFFLLYIY